MCEPSTIALISTGLSMAGSVGQYQQQSAAADAQNQTYAQNVENSRRAFETETRQLTDRQLEEQTATAQKQLVDQREYDATKATAVNAAIEKGASGLSFDGLLEDLGYQQMDRKNVNDMNLSMTEQQLQAEKESQGTNMLNRVNSVPQGQKPSGLGLAINIGGNLINGYTGYQKFQRLQTALSR